VWVDDAEVEALAIRLGMSENAFRRDYTRREGDQRTLIEKPNNDCIFYDARVGCTVYEQRPRQCRSWPFWDSNLKTERHWRKTVEICPGSGEGRLYTIDEIIEKKEMIRI
jgi:Fe-S-cluster containining protein